MLGALDAPRSTTELARALELSAGSVSQHLSVLREAGLVLFGCLLIAGTVALTVRATRVSRR